MSESNQERVYKCEKCGTIFKHEKNYSKHITNKLTPCSLTCIGCKEIMNSKASLSRHKKICDRYKLVAEEMKKRASPEYNSFQTNNNNNNTNNVTASSHNPNTQIHSNSNNSSLHNHNNVIMLSPYGLDHNYMWEDKKMDVMIGPARSTVVQLLEQKKYKEAYEILFRQMHGNPLLPQHHNVYMEDRNKDEVFHYRTNRFNASLADQIVEGLNRAFFDEMKWLINSSDLSAEDKDQLVHNLRCYYNLIDLQKDENMRRLLFNNRDIVKNTIKNNYVIPDIEMIRRYNKNNLIEANDRIILP